MKEAEEMGNNGLVVARLYGYDFLKQSGLFQEVKKDTKSISKSSNSQSTSLTTILGSLSDNLESLRNEFKSLSVDAEQTVLAGLMVE
jgi:hypothetical protein